MENTNKNNTNISSIVNLICNSTLKNIRNMEDFIKFIQYTHLNPELEIYEEKEFTLINDKLQHMYLWTDKCKMFNDIHIVFSADIIRERIPYGPWFTLKSKKNLNKIIKTYNLIELKNYDLDEILVLDKDQKSIYEISGINIYDYYSALYKKATADGWDIYDINAHVQMYNSRLI